MPFEVAGDEPLTAVINVRLTLAEKSRLRSDAELAGLTISALVRRRYFGRAVVAKTSLAVIAELRRLGGLLKKVNLETDFRTGAEVSAALRSIRAYIEVLADDREENTSDED